MKRLTSGKFKISEENTSTLLDFSCQVELEVFYPQRPSKDGNFFLPSKDRLSISIEYDRFSDSKGQRKSNTKLLYTHYGGLPNCWNKINLSFNLNLAQTARFYIDFRTDEVYKTHRNFIKDDTSNGDIVHVSRYGYVAVKSIEFTGCSLEVVG